MLSIVYLHPLIVHTLDFLLYSFSWISHNNYSSSIAKIKYKNIKKTVNANFFGNKIERLRFFKKMYLKFPFSFLKPIILFIYKYFFLLGFLDGKAGFYYCFFNSLWFRTLIEAKKYENFLASINVLNHKELKKQ